ncbi:hypothetical protein BaRGS_00018190 [Batillaria attramentaria]|uniref:Uncharacterized protein n=1 Tax=Batillaria attramentaria TaxID=370345 RepID=A0ABD0KUY9_9CAEN
MPTDPSCHDQMSDAVPSNLLCSNIPCPQIRRAVIRCQMQSHPTCSAQTFLPTDRAMIRCQMQSHPACSAQTFHAYRSVVPIRCTKIILPNDDLKICSSTSQFLFNLASASPSQWHPQSSR